MSGYTRQQSFTGGDTILAEHSNDEFDLLEEAFSTTLGHKHDGTAAEGPTIDLLSDNDNDTKIEVEATTDEDIIRFTTFGVERARIDTSGDLLIGVNPVWHSGNDGAASGLDADLLDGQEGAYYLPAASYTAADVLAKLITVDGTGSLLDADLLDGQEGSFYLPAASYTAADVLAKLITVDGAASGLDADLLDGQQGTFYTNASNLSSGTVPNARLTAATTSVAGIVQLNNTTSSTSTTLAATANAVKLANDNADTRLLASSYTAADVLSKLLTVDGAGSSLDADLLDGVQGSSYARSDAIDTISAVHTHTAIPAFNGGTSGVSAPFTVDSTFLVTNLNADLLDGQTGSYYTTGTNITAASDTTRGTVELATSAETITGTDTTRAVTPAGLAATYTAADVLAKLLTVDGSGSNLDADLLDGQTGSFYTTGTNISAASDTARGTVELATSAETITGTDTTRAVTPAGLAATYTAADVLTKLITVDGAGSSLDADLLDGVQGSSYAQLASPSFTGVPTAPTAATTTNTTQVATTAFVQQEIASTVVVTKFESTAQTITSGSTVTVAHGLGVKPFGVSIYLKCTTADAGWAVGDEVEVSFNNSSAGTSRTNTPLVDSTNITIYFTNSSQCFSIANKSSGVMTALTNADWELYIRAWV